MKYILALAAFAASALAQGISIASPASGSSVYPGQYITVEIDKPNFIDAEVDVAIVLSMAPCPSNGCSAGALGDILYKGPFNPQPEQGKPEPHENFSVETPTWFTPGNQVALIATYFDLVGAGPDPNIVQQFMPLNVVQGP
ncbi:hypothetical protein PsYK624_077020 [Phanerochaete sordida]|uniref:Uncharacterized protein n=1 Tax=Phanerochaete sordida TaxID=48140 RepID=A0A9P3G957_9APHY|nr:hypothetical protein PsYK624_077020 [Phanerochaete sordida]